MIQDSCGPGGSSNPCESGDFGGALFSKRPHLLRDLLTFPKLQRKLMLDLETIFSTSLPLLMTGPGAGGAAAEGSSSKGGGGGPAGSEIR